MTEVALSEKDRRWMEERMGSKYLGRDVKRKVGAALGGVSVAIQALKTADREAFEDIIGDFSEVRDKLERIYYV